MNDNKRRLRWIASGNIPHGRGESNESNQFDVQKQGGVKTKELKEILTSLMLLEEQEKRDQDGFAKEEQEERLFFENNHEKKGLVMLDYYSQLEEYHKESDGVRTRKSGANNTKELKEIITSLMLLEEQEKRDQDRFAKEEQEERLFFENNHEKKGLVMLDYFSQLEDYHKESDLKEGVRKRKSRANNTAAPHEILKVLDVSIYGENKYDPISCSYFICLKREIARINEVLRVVRDTHQLVLAQTWMLANSVKALATVGSGSYIDRSFQEFPDASRLCLIPAGQGVVGKAFSSKSASFCRDVGQLSIKEYPLAPNARKIGLSGCFAVCLQSSCSKNCTYTLEFFLPWDEKNNGDPRTLLHMLMLTLKEQLQSSFKIASGKELGQKLFVEVIKVSSDDTLDAFEICHTSGSESTLGAVEVHNAGGMMPPDSSSRQLDATHNCIYVVPEQQIGIVGSPPAPELVQNVVSVTRQQSNVELDATNQAKDGVGLEQSGINEVADLRKQGLVYILESQPWDYS